MTGVSGRLTTKERPLSAGQQDYRSPQYGVQDFHHVRSEPATISIQSLTSGYIQPLDFCVPVTRSHPGDEDQRREALHGDIGQSLTVEHLDISTAWNGLSDVDAKELFRVHRAFVSTLEKMLANKIWQIYQQLQQQDSAGNIVPIHTLVSAGIVRGISFCLDQLVSGMAEALYSSKANATKATSGFLRLYLMATDTLVHHHGDGSRDTSITVRVRSDPSSPRSYPVVDAAWVPDSIIFEGLDESAIEGQSFCIVPKYSSKSAFRPTCLPKNVKYSIESESEHSLSWLAWDDGLAGFKGIVPFYYGANGYDKRTANTCLDPSESCSKMVKIIVQAALVDDNGSSVRYERILRARLRIRVVPYYTNNITYETKSLSNEPKVYQDTRLSCAPQCLGGSFVTSSHSPSRLCQHNSVDPLHTPNECTHTGNVEGSKINHLTKISSATEIGMPETDLCSVAQTQAYLMAKCAELTRDIESVKKRFVMYGLSGISDVRTLHLPDPQEYLHDTHGVYPLHFPEQDGPTSGSSVAGVSHHAPEQSTTPSAPSLIGRDSTLHSVPMARLSVLPPPAIDLTNYPVYVSGTLNDRNAFEAFEATHTDWNSMPGLSTSPRFVASGENSKSRDLRSTQKSDCLQCLPVQASTSANDISLAHCSPRQVIEPLTTPTTRSELATYSASGNRGYKRRARSSLKEISPIKRTKDTEEQPEQDIGAQIEEPGSNKLLFSKSESKGIFAPTQESNGISNRSLNPLRTIRSLSTLASKESLASTDFGGEVNSSKITKNYNQDPGYCMATGSMDSDGLTNETTTVDTVIDDRATTAEDVQSNRFFQDRKGHVHVHQRSSASCSPQRASNTSTSPTCSTSSDVEFIVEHDTRARKVSRREQAKLWKLLSRSDSDNRNQAGSEEQEVRLSEDEKKAMDEALQRSLDDLAGGFDDIFLEEGSESNSGEDL